MESLFDIVISTFVFLNLLTLMIIFRLLLVLNKKLDQLTDEDYEMAVDDALYVTAFN